MPAVSLSFPRYYCSLCKSPNATKINCPLNKAAKNPNPAKHVFAKRLKILRKRNRQLGGGQEKEEEAAEKAKEGGKTKTKTKEYFSPQACNLSRATQLQNNTNNNVNLIYNNNINNNINNNTKKGFLPMSGSEPHYNPSQWNDNYLDCLNHNCYAYVLDNFQPGRPKRPQPGHRNVTQKVFQSKDFTREEIARRALVDNPSIFCTDPLKACPKGYYKGVLVIDTFNNYHWLRQDSNGYWSHKPGQLPVTNVDADGKLIKNPSTANLLYKTANNGQDRNNALLYTDIGPYFCIPSKHDSNIKLEAHSCEKCG